MVFEILVNKVYAGLSKKANDQQNNYRIDAAELAKELVKNSQYLKKPIKKP